MEYKKQGQSSNLLEKWRTENKTYLKDYRQQRREKEIDDAFNRYHQYLQTIE